MDRLGIFLECWGTTANANGDAITALTTVVIAVFTGVLTGVGKRQTKLAEMGAEAFRVVERAYVRMSHETPRNGHAPSALTFNAGVPHVRMEVKNWGATPARVTELVLQPDVRPSGDPLPPYNSFRFDPPQRMEAFVVPNTAFYFPGSFTRVVDVTEIDSGRSILRLIGYVEYTDKFGHRHRSGYARQYFPGGARNNLSFVTEAGYNDDTPIPS